jgi:glycosyltransferase involved in cell wall biosynthesis
VTRHPAVDDVPVRSAAEMLAETRIAVIIPAYRAADTIQEVVRGLPPFIDVIVVVDDACPEGTAQACLALNAPRLVVVRHDRNAGVGGATVTGFRKALECNADILVKMDADGQMDPAFLPALLEPLFCECDCAKANRFYDGEALRRMPWLRRWGNIGLSFLMKIASGYWNVYDPQNGYLAIRADTLRRLDLDGLDRGYFFENSLLIQLDIISARVAEVPIPARYGDEISSMNLTRILIQFPWKLVRGWLMRLRLKYFGMDFSPIAVLLLIGFPLFLGGIGYGIFEWVRNALKGVVTPAGTVMLAALPTLLGTQLLLTALLMEIGQTPPGLGIRKVVVKRSNVQGTHRR